jgi:hypothetical protein
LELVIWVEKEKMEAVSRDVRLGLVLSVKVVPLRSVSVRVGVGRRPSWLEGEWECLRYSMSIGEAAIARVSSEPSGLWNSRLHRQETDD